MPRITPSSSRSPNSVNLARSPSARLTRPEPIPEGSAHGKNCAPEPPCGWPPKRAQEISGSPAFAPCARIESLLRGVSRKAATRLIERSRHRNGRAHGAQGHRQRAERSSGSRSSPMTSIRSARMYCIAGYQRAAGKAVSASMRVRRLLRFRFVVAREAHAARESDQQAAPPRGACPGVTCLHDGFLAQLYAAPLGPASRVTRDPNRTWQ